jgi:hypothetical protein
LEEKTMVSEIVSLYLTAYLILLIHELGHLIVALYCKFAVATFSLGTGPILFRFGYNGISYAFHPFPFFGFVEVCFLSRAKWKNLAFFAGGCAANFLTGVMVYCYTTESNRFVWLSGINVIFNLIPFSTRGIRSDGSHIRTLWKQKVKNFL